MMCARCCSGLNNELKSSPVNAATLLASAGLHPRAPFSSKPHAPATRRTTCLSCTVQYASSAADAIGTSLAASVAPDKRALEARSLTTTNASGSARHATKMTRFLVSFISSPPRSVVLFAAAFEHLVDGVLEAEVGVLVAHALVADEQLRGQHRDGVRHRPLQRLVQDVLDLRR